MPVLQLVNRAFRLLGFKPKKSSGQSAPLVPAAHNARARPFSRGVNHCGLTIEAYNGRSGHAIRSSQRSSTSYDSTLDEKVRPRHEQETTTSQDDMQMYENSFMGNIYAPFQQMVVEDDIGKESDVMILLQRWSRRLAGVGTHNHYVSFNQLIQRSGLPHINSYAGTVLGASHLLWLFRPLTSLCKAPDCRCSHSRCTEDTQRGGLHR